MAFSREVLDTAAQQREVELTTTDRRTGRDTRSIIWVSTDGERLYVRSGGGLGRHWPQNLLASGKGILHLQGHDVPIGARLILDPSEARRVSDLVRRKYGPQVAVSAVDEPLTPGETASFELAHEAEERP